MNDIKLLGRLTDTPELKQSQSGRSYAWFTVAVPRRNDRKEADFIHSLKSPTGAKARSLSRF